MKIGKVTCSVGLLAFMLIWAGCSSDEKPATTDKSKQGSAQPTGDNNARSGRPAMAGGNMEGRGSGTDLEDRSERGNDPRSDADVSVDPDSARRSAASNANKKTRDSRKNRENANSGRDSSSTAKKKSNAAPKTKLVAAFPSGNGTVGLSEGDLVPEITGEDLEGTAFKLSDYKGKVIMLDFWGDW